MHRLALLASTSVLLSACGPGLPFIGQDSNDPGAAAEPIEIQLLSVSDWHGQLDPVAVNATSGIGGAPVLSSAFQAERLANPNTLTLTAGDSFGASPPLASFFEEKPAVLAMNLMKFDADSLGNHNFDRGVAHLSEMIDLADFPYVSANLKYVDQNIDCAIQGPCIPKYVIKDVGGVKVALIGITNFDAPTLTTPGSFGTIEVTDPVEAAMEARQEAKQDGADVFVVLSHLGAVGVDANGRPVGPLMEFAESVTGFDVIFGDHTNAPVNLEVNGALVVENKSQGQTYAKVKLQVRPHGQSSQMKVGARSATFVTPWATGPAAIPADPAVVSMLAPYRTQLAAAFDGKVAETTGIFARGNNVERLKEVPIGNLIADSMRIRYGTQLALVNGGGIRAPLPSSYLPTDTTLRRTTAGYAAGPNYDLVIGDVYTVLPFGNSVSTRTITGAQLWGALEHGVGALPNAAGKFPQISGFKVVIDSSFPAGSRVKSVTLDGGAAIPNDATTYTFATSDFLDVGGDGYGMFTGSTSSVSRDKMAEVLREHIQGLGVLTPATSGRITNVQPTP